MTTDHRTDVERLRSLAAWHASFREADESPDERALVLATAADLLELHDQTGVSLDAWASARGLVERLIGHEIEENGV